MMFCKLHLVDSRCLFSAFKPERTRNAAQHMQKADSNNCSKLFLSALFIRKPVFHQFPACLLIQVTGHLDLDGDVLVAVDVRIFHRYNSFSTQPDLAARLSPFFDFTTNIPV